MKTTSLEALEEADANGDEHNGNPEDPMQGLEGLAEAGPRMQ